jgi:Histidine kinase-like ATPase domain
VWWEGGTYPGSRSSCPPQAQAPKTMACCYQWYSMTDAADPSCSYLMPQRLLKLDVPNVHMRYRSGSTATTGGAVSSEAVSLGLIVTELVINALKHGFQGGEEGEILVKYDAQGSDWQLSVTDNGSGPKEAAGVPPHTGLGTIRRSIGASTQRHGREVEQRGGHVCDNYSSGASVIASSG